MWNDSEIRQNYHCAVEKIVSPAPSSDAAVQHSDDSQSSTKETDIKRQLNPLDPFQDQWKTVNLSEKITFHVYSAFAMKSNQNSQEFDQIRITAAIPSVYVVRLTQLNFK